MCCQTLERLMDRYVRVLRHALSNDESSHTSNQQLNRASMEKVMLMLESEQRRRRKHRSGSSRKIGVSRDLSPLTIPNGFGEHPQTDEGQVKQEEVYQQSMSDELSSSRDTLKVVENNLNPDSIGIYKRKPSKYLTRQVPLWSVEDVASWVKRIGFNAQPFIEAGVDGDLLLQIDDKNLQQDLEIMNGIHRKRFLRELNSLKKNADYSCMDRGNIAHFLAHNVGPDYKCYTYAFLKNDLTLELLLRLNEVDLNDMLQEAGVSSAIHKRKIIEAILDRQSEEEECSNTSSSSPHSSSFQTDQVDVFVSYPKQHGAAELASLVKMQLQLRGFSVYSDAQNSVSSNHENVLNYVREARNFVLILTPNALDDCIGDLDMKSYLHREIVTAIKSGCNIIPVLQDFQFPDTEELPENMRALCYFNGVRWIHDYQEACIDKLERFIRGESFLKADPRSMTRSTTRSRGDSGRSTPTAQVYTPLNFKKERCRTISIDSAIGSAASAF
ncbi:NAD(+) hydrolase sarm1-like isoform X2 [Tigriopus californicus]|uniref:NAD(+) hydrolase sarm1-like isoform X2 n=1 Tax=Tigriopus californicus TaxID=6832 RepID=UPI0027DA8600|nr:NAD(+) hydrolase sarm1-like isoform X2 [Tigriopus californicus]